MYQLINLTRTPNPTHQTAVTCDGCGEVLSHFLNPKAADFGYERGYAWHYCYTSDNGPRPRPRKEQ